MPLQREKGPDLPSSGLCFGLSDQTLAVILSPGGQRGPSSARRLAPDSGSHSVVGEPEEQAALLREDLDEPAMVMQIVSFEGKPFAYAQHYAVHTWPQAHFESLPPGSRAIDAFIGEPDILGKGHGSAFLRLLAGQLRREGAPVVAIDPDIHNQRAHHARKRASFRGDTEVIADSVPAILMIFEG